MLVRTVRACTMGIPNGDGSVERVDAEIDEVLDLPADYAAKLIASGAVISEGIAAETERVAAELEHELAEAGFDRAAFDNHPAFAKQSVNGPRVIGQAEVIGGHRKTD